MFESWKIEVWRWKKFFFLFGISKSRSTILEELYIINFTIEI